MRRVATAAVLAASLAGAGVLASSAAATGDHDRADAASNSGPPTVAVERTDLVDTVQVGGAITYSGSYQIAAPAGTSAAQLAQVEQALGVAEQSEQSDQTAQSDDVTADAETTAAAQATLASAQSTLGADETAAAPVCAGKGAATAACTQDEQKVTQDAASVSQASSVLTAAETNATKTAHMDAAKVAADATQVADDQADLTLAEQHALNPGTTYTGLPAVGQVIERGQAVYSLDGRPVPLLYGSEPAWRALQSGVADGPDVGELTANLIAMGYGAGLIQSDHFSAATAAAVARWQGALGLPQTGELLLGSVVFEPGAIRVTSVTPSLGAGVTPGAVLEATSTDRVVDLSLSVTQENLVAVGDPVSVILPDGSTTVPGHVQSVSDVATCPGGGDDGSGSGGSDAGGAEPTATCSSSSGSSSPTVAVTVTLDDPSATGSLDEAPVNVDITSQSADDVLAVPIDALLALEGGGDAVEVVAGGSTRLVAVQTGLYSENMVQISGAGISAGTLVEVPST